MQASSNGQDVVVRQLIDAGAEINPANSFGNTPLHTSCLNGHELVCKELIASGACITALNSLGQSALHVSAASTHVRNIFYERTVIVL